MSNPPPEDFTECLHEANPNGGFANQHGRLCWYNRACFADAVVHVRVLDMGWCGNVCGKCADRLDKHHRIKTGGLRGLSEENNGSETKDATVQ